MSRGSHERPFAAHFHADSRPRVLPAIRPAVRVTVTMQSTVETYRSIIPKLIFITGSRPAAAVYCTFGTRAQRGAAPPLKYERETLRVGEILRAAVIPRDDENRKGIIKRFRALESGWLEGGDGRVARGSPLVFQGVASFDVARTPLEGKYPVGS